MKRFYRLTPHFRLSHNPIFAQEVRRVSRGESAKTLIDYSVLVIVVACIIVLVLWIGLLLSSVYFQRLPRSAEFALMLCGLSLLAAFGLDYACMTVSIGSINGEITAGRWDLLRLTAIESKEIVAAKYGAAQVRAWRTMALIIALRVAVVLVAGLPIVLAIYTDFARYSSVDMPIPALVVLTAVAIACAIFYVVEPFLRMRTMTALGLAVSARVREPISSVLLAIGAIGVLWLVQGFVALALLLIVGIVIVPLASVEAMLTQGVICSPLLFVIAVGVTIYGFYSLVYNWSVRRALRFAARLDLLEAQRR